MKHRLESDSRLVRGLVLDHGARHPVRVNAGLVRSCFDEHRHSRGAASPRFRCAIRRT